MHGGPTFTGIDYLCIRAIPPLQVAEFLKLDLNGSKVVGCYSEDPGLHYPVAKFVLHSRGMYSYSQRNTAVVNIYFLLN